MIDYTQQLEQDVILNYFESKEHGILLDIGANDGETFSNSRALILNGWTGALVEPDPQPLYALEKLYYHNPSIQIIDNAIDNYNEKIMMHCSGTHLNMGDMGLLSTINEKEKERWHGETFTEVEVDVIDFKTLLDITKFTTIDFISIDAEGSDYRILEQIDLKALNCQMVCVEYNNIDGMKYVKYMEQFGFKVIMMNGCNIIMAL